MTLKKFNDFLNEAEHKAPLDYASMKIGDTLQNPDGTPWTEQDGSKIVVLNKGIALIEKNFVDIIVKTVLGKEERMTVSIANIKEIAKHLGE